MRFARRILCMVLLAALLLSLVGCTQDAAKTARETVPISSFREIPGITEDEIAAVEAAVSGREYFSYAMTPSTECFYTESGELIGFTALLCNRLSNLFDIPFRPVVVDWDALMAGMESQAYDFSADIPTQWRGEGAFYMTDAIVERGMRLFVGSGAEQKETGALRYGYLNRRDMKTAIAAYAGLENIIPVENLEIANRMLLSEDLDVFVGEEIAEPILTACVEMKTIAGLPYSTASIATCNPDLQAVIAVLQKYLQTVGGYEINRMEKEGRYRFLREKLLAQLSPEEQEYIKLHQNPAAIIPVGIDFDNYPYSFYNTQENEWQGMAVDLLEEIENLTGMHFAAANSRETVWADLLTMLEDGTITMTPELIRTPEREGRFLWTDTPYLIDRYGLLTMSEHPDISVSQIARTRVGLIADSAYAELFFEMYPNHDNTIIYANTSDAFDALEHGEIDALMMTRNLLLSATNYLERTGIKENLLFDRRYESYFGFNKNQEVLCAIVEKAQGFIDIERVTDSWTRKVFDYRGKMARAQVPYLVGAAILLVCVLILLGIMLIKNRQMGKHLALLVERRTEELGLQTEKAQIASRAKSDFLARMSHEIRTPLNAIIGMTEIAKRFVSGNPDKASASLDEISTASNHLMGILNDVLDMSKIEAGKFQLISEAFFLKTAMENVSKIIRQRCNEKHIHFFIQIDEKLGCAILGDRLRLSQVLINLLGNAVKFTKEDGNIRFSVEAVQEEETAITAQFTVADSGIGITAEQQKKLFKVFEQADDTIAVRFGGTGLGLTISQSLIQQMGGEITVSSIYGEGSVFTFTLCLPKVEMDLVEMPQESDGVPMLKGKRILLVEDIEVNRMILKELLAETQMEIDEAEDGAKAVKRFADSPEGYYQLIFMDIQMPNMGGYEATRCIRALNREDAATVPIIAMTANAYREDIDNALQAGMNQHLSKPIDINHVFATLRQWL